MHCWQELYLFILGTPHVLKSWYLSQVLLYTSMILLEMWNLELLAEKLKYLSTNETAYEEQKSLQTNLPSINSIGTVIIVITSQICNGSGYPRIDTQRTLWCAFYLLLAPTDISTHNSDRAEQHESKVQFLYPQLVHFSHLKHAINFCSNKPQTMVILDPETRSKP